MVVLLEETFDAAKIDAWKEVSKIDIEHVSLAGVLISIREDRPAPAEPVRNMRFDYVFSVYLINTVVQKICKPNLNRLQPRDRGRDLPSSTRLFWNLKFSIFCVVIDLMNEKAERPWLVPNESGKIGKTLARLELSQSRQNLALRKLVGLQALFGTHRITVRIA